MERHERVGNVPIMTYLYVVLKGVRGDKGVLDHLWKGVIRVGNVPSYQIDDAKRSKTKVRSTILVTEWRNRSRECNKISDRECHKE